MIYYNKILEYAGKCTLREFLNDYRDYELKFQYAYSLISDLIQGMNYLHQSKIGYHGYLTSRKCLITDRWELKISDFGLKQLKNCIRKANKYDEVENPNNFNDLYWIAPECIHFDDNSYDIDGNQKGDIYSIGIILNEIITRRPPFDDMIHWDPKDILETVKIDGTLRPVMKTFYGENKMKEINNIINECWAKNPNDRPNMSTITKMVRDIDPNQFNSIPDKIFEMVNSF